jgi:hypothetical protein
MNENDLEKFSQCGQLIFDCLNMKIITPQDAFSTRSLKFLCEEEQQTEVLAYFWRVEVTYSTENMVHTIHTIVKINNRDAKLCPSNRLDLTNRTN